MPLLSSLVYLQQLPIHNFLYLKANQRIQIIATTQPDAWRSLKETLLP